MVIQWQLRYMLCSMCICAGLGRGRHGRKMPLGSVSQSPQSPDFFLVSPGAACSEKGLGECAEILGFLGYRTH